MAQLLVIAFFLLLGTVTDMYEARKARTVSDSELEVDQPASADSTVAEKGKPNEKLAWETPKLEDVSEQVMAQPYIRFT